MNWISDLVRPKIRALVKKSDMPDNLWQACVSCSKIIFHRDLEKNLNVCTHCGHHMRFDVKKRLNLLFDDQKYDMFESPKAVVDPLKFKDKKKYVDRLKDARHGRKDNDDVVKIAYGTIGGQPSVVAAFDFTFMGGSMGIAVGEALLQSAELAIKKRAALVVIPASGGARMQEGTLSLMQMPRSIIAVNMVKEAGLPYIVILTDPTTGGVSASFAMLGDITMAEPGALVCFAGARVIEETIREKLPHGFQRAEFLLDHGMVDMVVPRKDMKEQLAKILNHMMSALAA